MKNSHIGSLALLLLATSSNALLGLGQNDLYPPDACGNTCITYFNSYRLTCSTLEEPSASDHSMMNMEADSAEAPVYITSDECRASNYPYIASIAWCWELNCLEISKVSNQKFVHALSETLPGVNASSFIDALSQGAPTKHDDPDQEELYLIEPLLVDNESFTIQYTTARDFLSNEFTSARMGVTLIMITWAL
ncbi:hypothetical protein CANINC_003675, partial [Pichia inconspicua]